MAEALELKAWTRTRTGKGGARASRREGRIPGILYGDKATPLTIDVDYKAINTQLHTGHFQSTIFMLDLDGAKTRVIPRQVQLDPIRDFPIHVDDLGRGLVAIEDSRDTPLAARRASAALAGARPRPGLEFQRLSHEILQ